MLCFIVSECPQNCRKCYSPTTCGGPTDECKDHYVWNNDDGLCVGKEKHVQPISFNSSLLQIIGYVNVK